MAGHREFDEQRLKAVMAYIAGKTTPGKLKLFKLLYLADFSAYVRLGRSITGESYLAKTLGPVPENLDENFQQLTAGVLRITMQDVGAANPEQRMNPLPTAPSIAILEAQEKVVLDDIITKHGSKSGTQLTAMTHQELPYSLHARRREVIPYAFAGYRNFARPTPAEIEAIVSIPDYLDRVRGGIEWFKVRKREESF
jgi:uncharacterized phage-associated protein